MTKREAIELLREQFTELADNAIADGLRIKRAKFHYNTNNRCHNVEFAFDEPKDGYFDPIEEINL